MRGELTAEKETQVIQLIIGKGLEREELRDEILVQCVRQVCSVFFCHFYKLHIYNKSYQKHFILPF